MGSSDGQKHIFHTVQLEDLVPDDHPLRRIRPLIDTARIRELCADFYSADNGRPSIPPEQIFLAMLGGYLLGCRSDRLIIRQLTCDMAFRWFAGLDIDSPVWDPSTFSKNRENRFDESGIFEKLFDDTVLHAKSKGWVSVHWSVHGTPVRANASLKSLAPIEVYQSPEQYRETVSGKKKNKIEKPQPADDDKGNPSVGWHGEKRTNATHRSTSDPDSRLATKSNKTAAVPSYVVNGTMENRNRILTGIGVELFTGKAERDGAVALLDRAQSRYKIKPTSLGADKGYFEKTFAQRLLDRKIAPHLATMERGRDEALKRIPMKMSGAWFSAESASAQEDRRAVGRGKGITRTATLRSKTARECSSGSVHDRLGAQS